MLNHVLSNSPKALRREGADRNPNEGLFNRVHKSFIPLCKGFIMVKGLRCPSGGDRA